MATTAISVEEQQEPSGGTGSFVLINTKDNERANVDRGSECKVDCCGSVTL